jgi:vacuolar-type H+-ATPase subunit I/STV1
MLKKLKGNFDRGVEKIQWISSVLSERLKIELSVVRLLYYSEKLEKEKKELMNSIGQRVYDLKSAPERSVLKDSLVAETLKEIERLEREIDETKKKASEISRIEDT